MAITCVRCSWKLVACPSTPRELGVRGSGQGAGAISEADGHFAGLSFLRADDEDVAGVCRVSGPTESSDTGARALPQKARRAGFDDRRVLVQPCEPIAIEAASV